MNDQRRQDKRSRILDAATIEIARRGYHGTTVAMIARRAGVADGTIYLYFRNKDEILVQLFERAMGRFIAEGKEELATVVGAEAQLRRIIELHLAIVGRDRDLAIITQVELRHSLHFLEELSRAQVGEYLAVLAGIVAAGQAAGEFRPDCDPLFVAKAVFGVLDEMATDWVLSRRNTRLEGRADEVAEFVLRGVRG